MIAQDGTRSCLIAEVTTLTITFLFPLAFLKKMQYANYTCRYRKRAGKLSNFAPISCQDLQFFPGQVSLTRKEQLAAAAAIQQKHAPEEEDEQDDVAKKPRNRRAKTTKGQKMKRPAASTKEKGVPKTRKSTCKVKEPKAPKGKAKAKAKAKPGRKAQVSPTPEPKEAETSEAIPKTTGRKQKKANAETEATSIEPKTAASTSKRSKRTQAKENSNTPAIKATFARRWPPKMEPSRSFHNALRAAFESEVQEKVKTPSKLEDTLVSCACIH